MMDQINQRKNRKQLALKKRYFKSFSKFGLLLVLLSTIGLLYVRSQGKNTASIIEQQQQKTENEEESLDPNNTELTLTDEEADNIADTIRVFSDDELKVFFDNLLLPDLERVENSPAITANDTADIRIKKIAEDRGYRLRSSPSRALVMIEGHPLQPRAAETWSGLKKAGAAIGFNLQIVSGFRSVGDQRVLFLASLRAAGISNEAVAGGTADAAVNELLKTAAPPGYSKHHSGYTIDVTCNGIGGQALRKTVCYDWFSDNNFLVLKEHGWIPSYPETAQFQGPEPEPWEFVWVGRERLLE